MVTLDDNKNESFIIASNEDQGVNLGSIDFKYVITLFDLETYTPLDYDEDLKRYLNITSGLSVVDL